MSGARTGASEIRAALAENRRLFAAVGLFSAFVYPIAPRRSKGRRNPLGGRIAAPRYVVRAPAARILRCFL